MNTPVQAPQSGALTLMTARPANSNDNEMESASSFQQALAQQVKRKPAANDKGNAASNQDKAQPVSNMVGKRVAWDTSFEQDRPGAFRSIDALAEDGKLAMLERDFDDKGDGVLLPLADSLALPLGMPVAAPAEAAPQVAAPEVADVAEEGVAVGSSLGRDKLNDILSKALTEGKAGSDKTGPQAENETSGADLATWIERMLPKMKVGEGAVADKVRTETVTESRPLMLVQELGTQAPSPFQNATPSSQLQQAAALGNINTITAYPGRAGWDQAIGQKVIWMAGNGEQSATLNLNPPELGPLQVVIHVHNDKADASFMSNNQEVRQALQDGMDNLRQMMSSSGIQLGQTSVGEHNQSQQEFAMNRRFSFSGQGDTDRQEEGAGTAAISASHLRGGDGLVDTFV